jgi:hypothetical protein
MNSTIMKRYLTISLHTLVAAIMLIPTMSCEDELNGIRPKNAISQDDLIDADIAKLRIGTYAQMENMTYAYYYDFDVRGENFREGPAFSLIDPVNMSPSDASLLSLWRSSYTTLNRVNFLLESISNSSNPDAYNSIKGEALYFRALIYYNLVTRWGGVPILTEKSYDAVPRATEAEVWSRIKADLIDAETYTLKFSNKFYVSKEAVIALLARVYLATGDKPNAIAYADKILTSTAGFTLAQDATGYSSMFVSGNTSRELLFAFANNNSSNIHPFYQMVNDVDPTWNYSPTLQLHGTLYSDNRLAKGDKRASAVFSSDNTRIIKYPNGVNGQQLVSTTEPNFTPVIVSRLAEIYLIKAEALGAGTGAETLLTYLSARYTNKPEKEAIVALSAVDFQNLILDENRREFYAEGHRWYDLKRTGRTDLLSTLSGRKHLLYYPIPQTERDLAGYTQNDGY